MFRTNATSGKEGWYKIDSELAVLYKACVLDAERHLSGPETVTDDENDVASPRGLLLRARAACAQQHDAE